MPARRAGLVCLCFSGAKNGKSLGKAQQLKHTSRYSPSLETETKADAFPHFMPINLYETGQGKKEGVYLASRAKPRKKRKNDDIGNLFFEFLAPQK